jgi:hypothetical protein
MTLKIIKRLFAFITLIERLTGSASKFEDAVGV